MNEVKDILIHLSIVQLQGVKAFIDKLIFEKKAKVR